MGKITKTFLKMTLLAMAFSGCSALSGTDVPMENEVSAMNEIAATNEVASLTTKAVEPGNAFHASDASVEKKLVPAKPAEITPVQDGDDDHNTPEIAEENTNQAQGEIEAESVGTYSATAEMASAQGAEVEAKTEYQMEGHYYQESKPKHRGWPQD